MPDFTFVVRLDAADDPTAAQLVQRAAEAAQAFGGELVAWETGSALERLRHLHEQYEALRGQLMAHGLLTESASATERRHVAGEVVAAAAAPPPPPGGSEAAPVGRVSAGLRGLPEVPAALLVAAVRSDLTQLAHAVGELAAALQAQQVDVPPRVPATVRRLTAGGVDPLPGR